MKTIVYISMLLLFTGTLTAEIDTTEPAQKTAPQNTSELTLRTIRHPELGVILTDNRGMTLYVFTPDKNKTSTCYKHCAIVWPPLLISSGKPSLAHGIDGTLDTTKRTDNTLQVTYNGMPLYYYAKDKKPGDAYGQNVDNKWYVIHTVGYHP